jgi:hypothetical protein
MKPVLIAGITIVNLALISYSIAIITQSRKKLMSRQVLTFLTIGVMLDITATICMVIGSGHFITLHGVIGYSSLAGMLTDTILSYRFASKNGVGATLTPNFSRWSQLAYFYWVVAYVTGAMIVMMK